MAMLGGFALVVPEALGSGFVTITDALHGNLPIAVLLLLPLAKLVATALTLGCGGSGGLFTPSLFFGALVGGAYGYGVHALFPSLSASYGAYAAVGMAAVAAGSSHAPLSAILILFEFTGNYELVLPLMVAAIVSSVVAKWLYPYSIYTEPLQRRGVELSYRMEEAALAGLGVGDLAREDLETLRPSCRIRRSSTAFSPPAGSGSSSSIAPACCSARCRCTTSSTRCARRPISAT
jgi:chloride channel protein, CIC family